MLFRSLLAIALFAVCCCSQWIEDTSVGSPQYWSSVASSADGTKLVAAARRWTYGPQYDGNLWTSTDAGGSWTSLGISRDWNSIASSANGTKLVAGSPIYTSTDSGGSWTSKTQNSHFSDCASSADGTTLLAGQQGGRLWISTDSGGSWTEITSVEKQTGQEKWYVASSANGKKLVAAAYFGNIWTSTDSGSSWTAYVFGGKKWTSVASSADGTKLVAASEDYLWTSADAGVSWTSVGIKHIWTSVASSADGTKLVACCIDRICIGKRCKRSKYEGNLWISTDSGGSWTEDTSVGSKKKWSSVASSAHGTKLVAAVEEGNLWTIKLSYCPIVADGTCDTCSDDQTTCTAVTCAANKFNNNGNAADGCESAFDCVVVAYSSARTCNSAVASGIQTVTCNTGFVSFCYC